MNRQQRRAQHARGGKPTGDLDVAIVRMPPPHRHVVRIHFPDGAFLELTAEAARGWADGMAKAADQLFEMEAADREKEMQ